MNETTMVGEKLQSKYVKRRIVWGSGTDHRQVYFGSLKPLWAKGG